jgi:hypothetical protein
MAADFRSELENLINRHSKENGSNTPDFILADYLGDCLDAFDKAVTRRKKWSSPEAQIQPDLPMPVGPDLSRILHDENDCHPECNCIRLPVAGGFQ